jgi:hypothetical protein
MPAPCRCTRVMIDGPRRTSGFEMRYVPGGRKNVRPRLAASSRRACNHGASSLGLPSASGAAATVAKRARRVMRSLSRGFVVVGLRRGGWAGL